MSHPLESQLLSDASSGDRTAFESLIGPLRRPLFSYIYRMTTSPQDAEDLLQDTLVRVLESLPSFRRESQFKTWLFGIATHVCLDHLRSRKRWRLEAQLIGESEVDATGHEAIMSVVSDPSFVFEIREHIAFCFACVARTLEPDEQAVLLLREVLGFSNQESADILEVSEPVFRHRLSSARSIMGKSYEGLCQLINKTGLCYQCGGLRELTPEHNRGRDLVQIEVAPGVPVSAQSLLDARLEIVRHADLERGRTEPLHRMFFQSLSVREESR
ncbi:MAG: sigma-70 family RNA polymerase sigma factor [Bryobacteraceae bacterium]